MKFLLPCLFLFTVLCLSPAVYATSIGTLDGSPVNFPPGMLVENRAFVSPYMIFFFVLYAQLGGLVLISLPLRVYHGLRKRWPQSPAMRHRLVVISTTLTLLLAAIALMRSGGTMRTKDILLPLVACFAGYSLFSLSDYLVVRRIWQRFARLPRWLRPVTAFLLPLFVVWLVMQAQQALIRATITTHTYPQLRVPDFTQGTPTPPPPNASPDQPPTSPPPRLTLPHEAPQ